MGYCESYLSEHAQTGLWGHRIFPFLQDVDVDWLYCGASVQFSEIFLHPHVILSCVSRVLVNLVYVS